MSCYYPLPAIKKLYPDKQYRVGKRGEPFSPFIDTTGELIEPIKIPCGKCIGCRLDYSRNWANRLVMESLEYPINRCWFLTLTYNDESLLDSKNKIVTEKGTLTLQPKHVTDFLKRLRSYYNRTYNETNIRYYYCGEYGKDNFRPHYHLLLFNIDIKDLKFYSKDERGYPLYNSQLIEDLWSYGFVVIGELNWDSCAYTARYVMKKRKGKDAKEYYDKVGLQPEFVRMSRKPGIGSSYYDKHKDNIYQYDSVTLPNGKVVKPPKYFDNLYSLEHPDILNDLKLDRRYAMDLSKIQRKELSNYSEEAYNKILEQRKKDAAKGLTRKL